jgi:3-dehydroquinate synthase
MNTVTVRLAERSYDIHIGSGLLEQTALFRDGLPGQQVLIVTNTTIAPLYLERTLAAFSGLDVQSLVLPDGEAYKTPATLNGVFDALLGGRFARDCTLAALGGGVIGDLTGFGAACYQRGVAFLQIPTTLLAQVDSSVGGKTGVNHPLGKNMIGAFHQPIGVIADTDTLGSLDQRQFRAGIAEVVKYGLIGDRAFFEWLEVQMDALLDRDPQALAHAIGRSCENKARVVSADERERGPRALLNLGHTFGHAIETGLGYGRWLHGEAVAAGTCLAADFSARLGWIGAQDVARIRGLFERIGLPVHSPRELDPHHMRDLMAVDKKVKAGRQRLVLLKSIGEAVVHDACDPGVLGATLADGQDRS